MAALCFIRGVQHGGDSICVVHLGEDPGVSGIESSTASVLNGTVPLLFAIILARFCVSRTEAVTGGKVVGLLPGCRCRVAVAPELGVAEILWIVALFCYFGGDFMLVIFGDLRTPLLTRECVNYRVTAAGR